MPTTIEVPGPISGRLKSQPASKGGRSVRKGSARKSRKRVKLPIIRSKESGVLALDNDKIFQIIPFP